MSGNYDRILEPVQFGSLTLKNRVIMPYYLGDGAWFLQLAPSKARSRSLW